MKTKRFLSCILSLVMLLSMLPATHITVSAAYDWFAGGSGTEEDPYLVSTMQQLRAVAAVVNGGDDFSGKYIQLKNDITEGRLQEVPMWAELPGKAATTMSNRVIT